MLVTDGSGAAAQVAEEDRQRRVEEEEEMNMMNSDYSGTVEYKIIRSATGAFKDPAKFQAALDAEGIAGWDLVEKLDNHRARLRRSTECRKNDAGLGQDPYRIQVGMSEVSVAVAIAIGVLVTLLLVLVVFWLLRR